MDEKMHKRLLALGWLVVLVLMLVLIGRVWLHGRKNEVKIPDSDWAKLMLVLQSVDRDYVDEIDQKAVTEQILPDILAHLDPHSVYLPPVEMEEAEQDLQGGFDGIGIQFNVPNDTAVVTHVIAGGPSEKAGLLSGDRIVQVDDRVIAGTQTPQDSMVRLMKGKRGSQVRIYVQYHPRCDSGQQRGRGVHDQRHHRLHQAFEICPQHLPGVPQGCTVAA